jgi:hypothetical protein
MRIPLTILAALFANAVQAASPGELLTGYQTEAARQSAGFQPSAQRGAAFHARRFGVSARLA